MPISFNCTTCQKPFKVSSKLAGKKIRCKGCNGVSRIPEQLAPVTTTPVAAAPPDDFVEIQTEWIVECDDCGRKHKPDERLMGKRVRCKCGTILHLTENPNAGIPLAPLEPELADMDYGIQPVHAPVYQTPPPSFQKSPQSIRAQRRREAEEMVRAADQKDQWRATRLDDDDDDEWGPMGKIIGGGGMIVVGGALAFFLWQAGYIYPYGFILMALGAISMIVGFVETAVG